MNELLNLLKDGHARTTLMLASELHTTPADIRRKLEFLENAASSKEFPLQLPPAKAAAAAVVRAAVRMQGTIRAAKKERTAAQAASPARNL